MLDYTPIARLLFRRRGLRTDQWRDNGSVIQLSQLKWLLKRGASTAYGRAHSFADILKAKDLRRAYAENVPMAGYEEFRPMVMRMTDGEADVLWPGVCRNFAQSSGTSGGRSKYIPITRDSLRINHFPGSADVMAQYLRHFPESRIFSGKGFILGGSFETELHPKGRGVKVGDLSATLIDSIPAPANAFRIPDKSTALLADWSVKLDRLARAAIKADITNISGVPSWFLRVLLRAVEISGKKSAHEIWPNLEVFFHGGISFEPYRQEYRNLFDTPKMHYFETYNASEGFFATQAARDNDGMLLLIDNGIYFEFLPTDAESGAEPLGVDEVETGTTYELVITSCNGLWRYRIGDTVKIVSRNPLKIRIAGRTRSFINAFGEELMESNADGALAEASRLSGALIRNYMAGPLYAGGGHKGRHQWLIEWDRPPRDPAAFARILDDTLKTLNSDYAAKRSGNIFLDPPEVISIPDGTFDRWLSEYGSGKLGGQRKIPRLNNDRTYLDAILRMVLPR